MKSRHAPRRLRLTGVVILAALLGLVSACEKEPDALALPDARAFFLPRSGPSGAALAFRVDSVVYDPAVGGTARLASASTWTLERADADPADTTATSTAALFRVTARDTSGRRGGDFLWDWIADDRSVSNRLDGVEHLSLLAPLTPGTAWSSLPEAELDREIAVAGEPVAIHKGWGQARIDSVATYTLPSGTAVEAVYVTLSEAENLLELREYREVYGRGLGLLERRVRILDTQVTDASIPWSERAERGFELALKRSGL